MSNTPNSSSENEVVDALLDPGVQMLANQIAKTATRYSVMAPGMLDQWEGEAYARLEAGGISEEAARLAVGVCIGLFESRLGTEGLRYGN